MPSTLFSTLMLWVAATVDLSVAAADCGIQDLHVSEETPRSVALEWLSDCQGVAGYKVYVTHQHYLACSDAPAAVIDQNASDERVEETDAPAIKLNDLRPFSKYKVEVMALLADGQSVQAQLSFTTQPDVPDVQPLAKLPPKVYSKAMRFDWLPAPIFDCAHRNGRADGYHVELVAEDAWGRPEDGGPVQSMDVTSPIAFFERLMPFTRYRLRVFARNRGVDAWNDQRALEATAQTPPTAPEPPKNVRVAASTKTAHMHWTPQYPPTGEVDHYVVRVGEVGDAGGKTATSTVAGKRRVIWRIRDEVPADRHCLRGQDNQGLDEPICWQVNDLQPNTWYAFEVRTINVNVTEASNFSSSVYLRTEPEPTVGVIADGWSDVSATSTPSSTAAKEPRVPTQVANQDKGPNPLLVVIILMAAIVLVILVSFYLFYKIKMSKVKMKYERQTLERRRGGGDDSSFRSHGAVNDSSITSAYFPSNVTETTTNGSTGARGSRSFSSGGFPRWSAAVDEIQSRRLPEPPPNQLADAISLHSRERSFTSASATKSPPGKTAAANNQVGDSGAYADVCDGRAVVEVTDMDGYLRPTFVDKRASPTLAPPALTSPPGAPIPVESYQTPADMAIAPSSSGVHLLSTNSVQV